VSQDNKSPRTQRGLSTCIGVRCELSYFAASLAVTRMGVPPGVPWITVPAGTRMVGEVSGGSSRQAEVSHPAFMAVRATLAAAL
jgi:hypothetical protein